MSRQLLLSTAAAIAITTTACSLFAAPSTDLETLKSGTYSLDKSHANVLFNLSHMGYSRYFGRFNAMDGALEFDAKNPENSKLNITVDIASIDTNNQKLEDELRAKEWFDAKQFPTATFTSKKIQKLTATTGKVTGDLTLHGVTKPVVLDVTFNGGGENPIVKVDQLGFSATTHINRSDFGISTYLPMIGDTVALTIETEFHLKK